MAIPTPVLSALPGENWLSDAASLLTYGFDNSKRCGPVLAVALPTSEAQVQALMRACAASRTPIVARGRGTATTGAAVPVEPSIVVCFERMQRVLRLECGNRFVVVEPGLINGDLQRALAPSGFFWPPDPTSASYSTIGGNLACNAGGPRTVKYGASRDNVLGLRVVTGAGEIITSGSFTTKGAVGYDLTRLIIGSEGTLGLITAATLKLTPLPSARVAMRALYDSIETAAEAVARIMSQAHTPSALEFMDGTAISLVRQHAGLDLPETARAMLLIEADGSDQSLEGDVTAILRAANGTGCLQVRRASSPAEATDVWAARKALSPILRSLAPKKINEDVVVPVEKLPELVRGIETAATRHAMLIVNFGHAGNGNLHVNLLFDPAEVGVLARAHACLDDIFDCVIRLDGTISGEHGIGLEKRAFVSRAIDPPSLALMRRIKSSFDPAGILNPGKIFPPE